LLPDPSSVADILNYYYEDRNALKAAGNWCYERIHEKQFTWPVITKKMLRIVEEVLSQKPSDQEFKGFGTPAKIV
jgi:glycosyltransferase involved in cell wall biosynthesis